MNHQNVEEIASKVVDTAFRLHRDLGPGLLESVYEVVLAKMLQEQGLKVARQAAVPIRYAGLVIEEGFRADLVVEEAIIVELKSVEELAPVHHKQLLTYLRLTKCPLGFLINFGADKFSKGVRRLINGQCDLGPSPLRVNRPKPTQD